MKNVQKWLSLFAAACVVALTSAGCVSEGPSDPEDDEGEATFLEEEETGEAEQSLCANSCSYAGWCGSQTSWIYHCTTTCGYSYYATCVPWRGYNYCAGGC